MTYINIRPNVYEAYCVRCSKEREAELRNSDCVMRSIAGAGNKKIKEENYYRLVNGTAPDGAEMTYRANECLIPSGKVLLDYDNTDWRETIWPKIVGKEKELGILQIEISARGKLHITVRRIEGLTIGQTIEWFEKLLEVTFDHVKDLARACFLVPTKNILYIDEAYYDDIVETQQQDISDFQKEELTVGWEQDSLEDEEALIRILEQLTRDNETEFEGPLVLSNETVDYTATTTPVATPQPDNEYRRIYERDEDEFQRIVNLVVKQRIDIAPTEPEWFRMAIACFCVLGAEEGRMAFHRLSQFYPRYSYKETDEKFRHVVMSMYSSVGLGSLIFWCKNAGVKLNEEDIAR